MTPSFADLTARRTAERARLARERAALVVERLGALGVEARIVGSLARGDFRLHSDVDFLILACPPELKYRLEAEVEDLMEGLPFDCIYLDEVRPDRRAAARGGPGCIPSRLICGPALRLSRARRRWWPRR